MFYSFVPYVVAALSNCEDKELRSFLQLHQSKLFELAGLATVAYQKNIFLQTPTILEIERIVTELTIPWMEKLAPMESLADLEGFIDRGLKHSSSMTKFVVDFMTLLETSPFIQEKA